MQNRRMALSVAADFIEHSFSGAGLQPRRETYEVRGRRCSNVEVEIPGAPLEIVLIAAHHDSVFGSPGPMIMAAGWLRHWPWPGVIPAIDRLSANLSCRQLFFRFARSFKTSSL